MKIKKFVYKNWAKIIVSTVLIVIAFFTSYYFFIFLPKKEIIVLEEQKKQASLQLQQRKKEFEESPLKIINCKRNLNLHYWNYWTKDYDYSKYTHEEIKNKRQGNFYISCEADGASRKINAYVFKDGKLFFKQENIYRGNFFKDSKNNFYITQRIINSKTDTSDSGYIVTRYEFDSSKKTLIKKEVNEYKTVQELEELSKFEKEKDIYFSKITYNQVMNSKAEVNRPPDFFNSQFDGRIIEWKAKISARYSQIDGIKFCVVDENHQDIDIYEACDWFWAFSSGVANADNLKKNPNWDGHWVNYVLNYYKIDIDKEERFYDKIFTVKGMIYGFDCGFGDKCIPLMDIISITK